MILEAEKIFFGYSEKNNVLNGVDLSISDNALTAVIGCNGGGKSTLLKVLAGIIMPASGTVRCNGEALKNIAQNKLAGMMAYLPQNPEIPAGFTVMELLECGRYPCGTGNRENREIICRIMEDTGITELETRSLASLSGGEKQRVFLAFALVRKPEILLLDEPFSALDPKAVGELFQLIIKLKEEHKLTIVTVLHDINRALKYCDFIVGMKEGKIQFNLPPVAAVGHIPALYDLPENSCITDINGNKYFL